MRVEVDSILLNQGFQVQNNTGHHTFIVDEPKTSGGTDLGPDPVQIFLASISSCITVTTESYARAKGISIEKLHVRVWGDFQEVYSEIENPANGFRELDYSIYLKTSLSKSEQEQFIADVEEKCPLLQTLLHSVIIKRNETADLSM